VKTTWMVVLALAIASPVAWSGDGAGECEPGRTAMRSSDADFLRAAGQAGIDERALAHLVSGRARNGAFLGFADRLLEDQEGALDRASVYSREVGVSLPTEPTDFVSQDARRLRELKGEGFERAWLRSITEDLVRHVQRLEATSYRVEDRSLGLWASRRIAREKDHLAMAREMAKALGMAPSGA
jgi:predicted outer membrane protein